MNNIHHKVNSVALRLSEFLYEDYSNEFLHTLKSDLRSTRNKALNSFQLSWKPLKSILNRKQTIRLLFSNIV